MTKNKPNKYTSIDFEAIYASADCHTVAAKYLTESSKKGRYDCPKCQKQDAISTTSKVWTCWKSGCHEESGRDAVGLVAVATGASRLESAKLLAADLGIGPVVMGTPTRARLNHRHAPPDRAEQQPQPWENVVWTNSLMHAVEVAHERLMDRADDLACRAWDYLTIDRRLNPETIERHKLGLNLEWIEAEGILPGKTCYLPPGIVIPWLAGPGGIAGANIRQFHKPLKDKYIMATGSRRRWSYPGIAGAWLDWTGPVVIVEGEFDALIGNQELNGLLPVLTAGGAQSPPWESADSPWLGKCSRLLICTDADDAGQKCWNQWENFSPRTRRVNPPTGKDLTASVQSGVDLVEWVKQVCTDHGIDLHALPGLLWEQPLGTIRGRQLEPGPGSVDPYDAEERAAIETI